MSKKNISYNLSKKTFNTIYKKFNLINKFFLKYVVYFY